jgi:transcription initiation factor TFIID subunit TAF12
MTEDQHSLPILTRIKLREIATSTIPNERLDFESETFLLHSADEFIEDLLSNACKLAKHRGSENLEATDMLLYLERYHDISFPAYESVEEKAASANPATASSTSKGPDEHARRMAHVQRASSSMPSHQSYRR